MMLHFGCYNQIMHVFLDNSYFYVFFKGFFAIQFAFTLGT